MNVLFRSTRLKLGSDDDTGTPPNVMEPANVRDGDAERYTRLEGVGSREDQRYQTWTITRAIRR